MLPMIGIIQLCGFLFLHIFLTNAISRFMAGTPLNPENLPNALAAVAEGDKKFRMNIAVALISHVSIIVLSGLLYLTFSPYKKSLEMTPRATPESIEEQQWIRMNPLNK
ncbi:MAG TPA: hypothetical protein G4O14_02320 [Anaerolineae bacterium]|nr:hypothetical protein [Anaerolineae bacterium]